MQRRHGIWLGVDSRSQVAKCKEACDSHGHIVKDQGLASTQPLTDIASSLRASGW